MKKFLVMAAALALFAAPALAANIAGTAHDLSTSTLGSDEICVFCHTPHGANTTVTSAPLWNRTNFIAGAWTQYGVGSGTYDGGPQDFNLGSMPLCFSCHDGSAEAAEIFNQPSTPITGNLGLGVGNIATDAAQMSNDHPVGFVYDTALAGTDGELYDPATVPSAGNLVPNGIVECASCHDVHDDTFSPFLIGTNTASALCRSCHIK